MAKSTAGKFAAAGTRHTVVVISACALTLAFFLVLPLMQTLAEPDERVEVATSVSVVTPPPPPPPPEEPPEPPPPPEEPPPQLDAEPTLSLDEAALGIDPGGAWAGSGFGTRLQSLASGDALRKMVDFADLDQAPRVISNPGPVIDPALARRAPAEVIVIFIVNEDGRVENPIVQQSTDSAFNRPTIDAVKRWKFDPGKRQGEPVRFRMRVPIKFPKSKG